MFSRLTFLMALLVTCAYAELPPDRTFDANASETDRKIAPLVKLSMEQFPAIRRRFEKGLKPGEVLYVTVRVSEGKGFEQIFVEVTGFKGNRVLGKIASDIVNLKKVRKGDPYVCPVKDVLDWTMTDAQGREEGNFVGKFMDVMIDGKATLVVKVSRSPKDKPEGVFVAARNRHGQDVSYAFDKDIRAAACRKAEQLAIGRELPAEILVNYDVATHTVVDP